MIQQAVPVTQIVADLGGELIGATDTVVSRIAPLDAPNEPGFIAFLSNPKYRAQLATTQAQCVIVHSSLREEAAVRPSAILTDDPYLYFAYLTQWWAARFRPKAPQGVHPSAVVDPTAHIEPDVTIGPLAVVEAGARLEAGAVVGPHCVVGARATIGAQTRLAAHVTVGYDCHIGARCILHSGVVIGADGFGFAPSKGQWIKIEQLGAVRIGNDVEIGANTCVDRGALDDTIIGVGVKLDNLIQIGHNVQIGDHSAMAGCVGVAGSTRIGSGCTVGGAAMVLGHLTLADGVHISAATVVSSSIHKPGQYTGFFPLDDNASWEKNAATLRHLHALRDRIRALEKQNK
ncbi:UDP-3-O-(3-hydroxymyristoyl)glucosamine N-acyltransferase [Aquabacterium sp.]|uniref:UDP-3-O-(3-hydroxymyristoyl)glucosamine N-acyltransferase n=1 Tax=Aquabacterium sp. TaxID=1872578 RepID=UPI0039C8673B